MNENSNNQKIEFKKNNFMVRKVFSGKIYFGDIVMFILCIIVSLAMYYTEPNPLADKGINNTTFAIATFIILNIFTYVGRMYGRMMVEEE